MTPPLLRCSTSCKSELMQAPQTDMKFCIVGQNSEQHSYACKYWYACIRLHQMTSWLRVSPALLVAFSALCVTAHSCSATVAAVLSARSWAMVSNHPFSCPIEHEQAMGDILPCCETASILCTDCLTVLAGHSGSDQV